MIKLRKKSLGIHEAAFVQTENDDGEAPNNETFTIGEGASSNDKDSEHDLYNFPPGTNLSFPTEGAFDVQDDCSPDTVSQQQQHAQQDEGGPIYFYLPDDVKEIAPSMKARKNSGGGNCLCCSVAQQEGFDPLELKRYQNTKLIEWYVNFQDVFVYPLTLLIGSGNTSYNKTMKHKYEFFKFLRSDEALMAWNTGQVEIMVLATIINQPITLVTYNIQGLPVGTPPMGRCSIRTVDPIGHLKKENKFKTSWG